MRAAHGSREQDHLRFQPECGLAHRALHCGVHRVHLRGRDFLRDTEARAKSFVHFCGTEKLKGHLLATGAVDIEERSARKTGVIFKQAERLPVLPKSGTKTRGLFPGKLDDAQLRDHDRPTENRNDAEERENDLAGDSRVFEREEETAGRENRRKQHGRQLA